ncbi:MAG TPA: protein kinase [Drouetiella sp.]|jgi:serine/threonine protein kinase/tetratricopeptide (TPR) repeat protein
MTKDNLTRDDSPDKLYAVNQILDERYRVLSLLGRGGMGVVYKVEQIFLGKTLALKTIDSASQSEILVRRFQAEAKAIIAVSHPNIVAVHDFGVFEDGTPFLAMEFVEGQTLSQLIQSRTLSLDDALEYFIQVCFGLAHAHRCGIVHRDIKPGNLMIVAGIKPGADGCVKILDFGIAKLTQSEGGEIQSLTQTGEIFGSPLYMSPEQCVGGNVDSRSDVYSLGCVIFETLTGTPPFVGENALATMMLHQSNEIPSMKEASLGTDFPPELEHVVRKMLSRSPASRYQDLAIAAHDLAAIRQGDSQLAGTSTTKGAITKPAVQSTAVLLTMQRKHYQLSFALTAGLSIILSALVTNFWLIQRRQVAPKTVQIHERPVALPSTKGDESYDFSIPLKLNCNVFDGNGVTNASLKRFENYENAQSVSVSNELDANDLTEKGISYLAKNRLISLRIRCADVKNVDCILKQKQLQTLDLRATLIGDAEVEKLLQLKSLRILNLSDSHITERGVRSLLASKTLVQLILDKPSYSKSLIDEFHRKLPQCSIPYGEAVSPIQAAEAKLARKPAFVKHQALYQISRDASPDLSITAAYLVQMADDKKSNAPDYRKYLEEAKHIVERNGDEAMQTEVYRRLAFIELSNRNLPACMALSDKLIQLIPNNIMHDVPEFYIMIMDLVNHAQQAGDMNRIITYCDVGIRYGEFFRTSAGDFLASYYLQKGHALLVQKKPAEAIPMLQRVMDLTNGIDKGLGYYTNIAARVTYAHCLTNVAERKKVYDECIESIEAHKFPALWDLSGHYCDACDQMCVMYGAEGNDDKAIFYLKKELNALDHHMGIISHDRVTRLRQIATSKQLITFLTRQKRTAEAAALAAKYHL